MHFPEGRREQQRPSAAVKSVEVKQCTMEFIQYMNYKWKTNTIKRSWLVAQHIDIHVYIFIYSMIKISLHEGCSISTLKLYHTYYKQFTEFVVFAYTGIAKWIKIHWNIEHWKCIYINLPGLIGIGHYQHLPPKNKNCTQEKEEKNPREKKLKKNFLWLFLI